MSISYKKLILSNLLLDGKYGVSADDFIQILYTLFRDKYSLSLTMVSCFVSGGMISITLVGSFYYLHKVVQGFYFLLNISRWYLYL